VARPPLTIRWTDVAAGDLESIYEFVVQQNRSAADKVINRTLSAIDVLERFPEMGRPGRVEGTRELVVAPFIVAYRVRRSEVQILSILHAARKWPEKL
jgi:addiction module RelE/StbE family toxin